MAKGSQLSQLKSALSQAGVTGQQQSGKKRKRTNSQEKDKEKRAAKLDEIHKKLNPFDTKVTKLKHDVGGRKVKGVTGKPSQSKQTGLEQVRGSGVDCFSVLANTTTFCSGRKRCSRSMRRRDGPVGLSTAGLVKMTPP
jgi:hypothetical protein